MIGVYLISNLVNGKIYVGQTRLSLENRFKHHRYEKQMVISRAMRKYGSKNFKIEPVAYACSREFADFLEKAFIQFFQSKVPTGYNVGDGGWTGGTHCVPHSEATKRKLSELRKGKKTGKPAWNRGISHSDETRLKISLAGKGKKHSEETKNKIGLGNAGKIYSEETRKKISDWHRGRLLSESTKLKLSLVHKGRRPRHKEHCLCPFCKSQKISDLKKGGVQECFAVQNVEMK